jgi:hypothetical protein
MGLQNYRHILEIACATSPVWNADSIFHGSPIVSNNVRVWFQYFEPADLCRIVIDLGTVKEKARASIWRMMLESNCRNTSEFLPLMALNPENGNAILVMHLSMERLERYARKPDFFLFIDGLLTPIVKSWTEGNHGIGSVSNADSPMLGGFA